MFQINPLFAVPMAEVQYAECQELNQRLRALLLSREAEGTRYANPNPTMTIGTNLFESDFNVFSWPEPEIQALREFCWSALSRLIADLNGFRPEYMQSLQISSHTWFHVTRHGGQFGMHNHPMASWSGVYCVDPGDSDPSDPDSGTLTFVNPNGLAQMYRDATNVNLRRPYHPGNVGFPARAGRLVLFPSWVQHLVLPYRGQRERITIAFNSWFTQAEA